MYKIWLRNDKNKYELNELIKMFLKPTEYQVVSTPEEVLSMESGDIEICMPNEDLKKNEAKRYLFRELSRYTGSAPDWGTHTGVRPAKMAMEYFRKGASEDEIRRMFRNDFYIKDEKIQLLIDLCKNQMQAAGEAPKNSAGIYIGIPFCPTRCVYCSFTSNQTSYDEIEKYLLALYKEIEFTGAHLKKIGKIPESIYIGGGTPTTLCARDLKKLLNHVNQCFDMSHVKEFTVEAGRPDTITEEKLDAILQGGANRISINPQSMKQKTLDLIGRSHTPEEIEEAFKLAKKRKIPLINADLICGLPQEEPEDFKESLEKIIALKPANITIHTLAVKKASKLIAVDSEYNYRQGNTVRDMLEIAGKRLRQEGYLPYYMYRQKHMSGNFENIGYAKPGTESIYNIRIMEENQTIVALGAGGISKVYFPEENRLERVPNVSNYEIYIERIDEMIERKEKGMR